MGHLRHWLFRRLHRFRVWRYRRLEQRLERHENFIIAAQSNEIAELNEEKQRLMRGFEFERQELAVKIKCQEQEIELLHDLLAREKERVAFETAKFSRGVVECENAQGRIVT